MILLLVALALADIAGAARPALTGHTGAIRVDQQLAPDWVNQPGAHCVRMTWNRSVFVPAFKVEVAIDDGDWQFVGQTSYLDGRPPWWFSLNSWMPLDQVDAYWLVGYAGYTVTWERSNVFDGPYVMGQPREVPVCRRQLVLPMVVR